MTNKLKDFTSESTEIVLSIFPGSSGHSIFYRNKTGASPKKAFGLLVALGFDVAVFTPAPYQRRSLRRPYEEF